MNSNSQLTTNQLTGTKQNLIVLRVVAKNIANITKAVQCHSLLMGHWWYWLTMIVFFNDQKCYDFHRRSLSRSLQVITRMWLNVSRATSLKCLFVWFGTGLVQAVTLINKYSSIVQITLKLYLWSSSHIEYWSTTTQEHSCQMVFKLFRSSYLQPTLLHIENFTDENDQTQFAKLFTNSDWVTLLEQDFGKCNLQLQNMQKVHFLGLSL